MTPSSDKKNSQNVVTHHKSRQPQRCPNCRRRHRRFVLFSEQLIWLKQHPAERQRRETGTILRGALKSMCKSSFTLSSEKDPWPARPVTHAARLNETPSGGRTTQNSTLNTTANERRVFKCRSCLLPPPLCGEAQSVPVNPAAGNKEKRAVMVMAEDSALRSSVDAGQLDNRRNRRRK